ncbi:T9SS type A sorting domain-containing protein [Hymenobacter nivis]|uniref:T9SS type A sorting domain-containing protein n=1 Tax=Hymenobacter nivis TaxID=1850093 RepID=UPI0013A59F79|nr:T9SS type A sorting domain-containing protein [Hymenobacter nivis]
MRSLKTALLLAGLLPALAYAEGSKDITPGTGNRGTATGVNNYIGYLQHDDGANSGNFLKPNATVASLERLYVHLEPGEKLYYGLRRTNAGNANSRLQLEVKYGTGTLGASTILEPATGVNTNSATLAAARGVIATPEQAAVGPMYTDVAGTASAPAGGYNPLVFENTTGAAQEVWVEFEQVDSAGKVATSKAWYDCWDFTVRDDANATVARRGEKKGRLYSSAWSFTGATFNNQFATTFVLYPLIPNPNFGGADFFVKQVSYSRISPYGMLVTANEFGTSVTGDYKARRKSQPTSGASLGYAQYKMFVNDPDNAVYPSTTAPNSPTVTTACSGTAPNQTTTFTLAMDQAGFGIVFIDGNNNQTYEAAADRVLERQTTASPTANTFVWDGTTDTGARMPAGTINLVFSSGVGPVNFPMYDCEAADAAGITVRAVRPGNNNGFIDFLFYDDTNLDPNFSKPIRNPIGNNSASGAHKWGTAGVPTGVLSGDTKTVNSYAVGLLAQGHAYNVAYDGSGCVAVAAIVLVQPLPVELARFGAALQKSGVRVSWETASERDCAHFAVERSADGRDFAAVGQLPGSGTSTQRRAYAYLDPMPLAGQSYYRLRQVDYNGSAHLSPVEAVLNTAPGAATLYPNPATTEVTLRFAQPLAGPVELRVLDGTGRVVWQERRTLAEPAQELRVPTAQLPAAGLYLLTVSGGGTTSAYRFSK